MSYFPEENFISVVNSRAAATLAAGATFQGASEDVSNYGRAGVSIKSDNATDGTLTVEVSHDGVTWGGPPRTWSDTRFGQPHMWNIVEKYFRIKYVNGTTEAQNLSIQTQYSKNADILLGHQLDEVLLDETEALIVRSVGVGQDPNGNYTNSAVSGVDDANSSTTNLTAATSLTFTGTWFDISGYIGISVLVDGTAAGTVGGTLQMQFSHDASTVHRNIAVPNSDIANVPPRTLGVVAKYFRVIYTADSDLTSFVIETMFHMQQVALVSRLDQTLQGIEDVTNVRAALVGQSPGGTFTNVGISEEGALDIGVQRPLTTFGEVMVAEPEPRVQLDAVYGIRDNCETFIDTSPGTGSVTATDGNYICQTGTGLGGYGVIRSRRSLRYRPGQGALFRFTAIFDDTNKTANSLQAAGPFNTTNGLFVGYNGTSFGVMHRTGGRHETRTMTVTGGASGSENLSLTLNSVLYTIPVTNGTAAHNASEIADWLESNQEVWNASQNGDTVVLFGRNAGPLSGTYTVSSASLTGSIAQDKAGVVNTETWTAQADFSEDPLDGTGDSGMTLDPEVGNVFEVGMQYLGYGNCFFQIENPATGRFFPFHVFSFTGARTEPTFLNPTFKVGWIAASLGSTTNLTVQGASALAAIEGSVHPLHRPWAHTFEQSAITNAQLTTVLSIRVRNVFHDVVQLSEILPTRVTVGSEAGKTLQVKVLLNPTVTGERNWAYKDEAESIAEIDTTKLVVSDEGADFGSDTVASNSRGQIDLTDVHLERGDVLAVAVEFSSGPNADVTAAISWFEE